MANPERDKTTSKFLSYVLRHEPGAIGLELDDGGWAEIDELVRLAREDGREIDEPLVRRVVERSKKKRFAISEDGRRIRANYGHSIDVDLDLHPAEPPEELYHGTARDSVASILESGLEARSRQFVHLSTTKQAAREVGARHGEPVVLRVDTAAMYEDGIALFPTPSDVWLVERVGPEYIRRS